LSFKVLRRYSLELELELELKLFKVLSVTHAFHAIESHDSSRSEYSLL
jgi:hypothetical protein